MDRIDKKFKELRKENKKAFIPYICYGDPDIKTSEDLVIELSKSGADLIELGFPFSDPLADGPTIQYASQRALKHKVSIDKYLDAIKNLRKKIDIPLIMMSYYNPIFRYNDEKFIRNGIKSGLDGAIIPDLPIEEADRIIKIAHSACFDIINLVSPTTTEERMRKIAKKTSGFIYYVSLTGVTGARDKLDPTVKEHVKKLKKVTSKPVCVGFGISKPSQVKEVTKVADGVIVGSAIIDIISKNIDEKDLVKRVGKFVKKLARATFVR